MILYFLIYSPIKIHTNGLSNIILLCQERYNKDSLSKQQLQENIMMEINIKLKFDKEKKASLGKKAPFFLEAAQLRRTKETAQMQSFRQGMRDSGRKVSTAKKTPKKKEQKVSGSKLSMHRRDSPSQVQLHESLICLTDRQTKLRDSLPGLSGKKVILRFAPLLSEQQKVQLSNEKAVYYIGMGTPQGQQAKDGTYLWHKHEQVGYRYELLQKLGAGAFGQVIKAYDHKAKQPVAVKIIKARNEHRQLALNQINILMKVKEKDIGGRLPLLRIKDFIVFRKHICIITELLSLSLYDILQANQFRPLDPHNVRAFALQLLSALVFLKQECIVHADIKPENILLKDCSRTGLKVIDFGTSMFANETHYQYIQSRYYRAPQVLLGASYGHPIDMWSFGCLIAQLSLGRPLFAGENQADQLSMIVQALGMPDRSYLQQCRKVHKYFNKQLMPNKILKNISQLPPLTQLFPDPHLRGFLLKLLVLDPSRRLTPSQAQLEPWLLQDLSQVARRQVINEAMLRAKQEMKKSDDPRRHRKRNSDVYGGSKEGHRRRGSQGLRS